jgi:hypothetical protein
VTRATAAKLMPVDRHTISRMRGAVAIRCTASDIRIELGRQYRPSTIVPAQTLAHA